ncbi:MAG TPA: hypothetical protein VK822_15720, partial [Acetobacteraceae bacterium]|nr:hypothetical protein [Acetobacteraceae bacterium]
LLIAIEYANKPAIERIGGAVRSGPRRVYETFRRAWAAGYRILSSTFVLDDLGPPALRRPMIVWRNDGGARTADAHDPEWL